MSDIMTMADYEEVLKDLSRARTCAKVASLAAVGLDDKLRFVRLCNTLDDAWRKCRLAYYDMQDAIEIPVVRCSECGSVEAAQ